MLSGSKLKEVCESRQMKPGQLAGHLSHGRLNAEQAQKALNNWMSGRYNPNPSSDDLDRLAGALNVEKTDLSVWQASYRYAPTSPQKARLVADLIKGRSVQDALDVLHFTHNRAASMFEKLLKSAIANADEQEADVERLYVCEARVDGAGRRIGTKMWMAKDRGRAHPIKKQASHLHVTLDQFPEGELNEES